MTRILPQTPDTLDRQMLCSGLSPATARLVARLDVFADIDSTSSRLLRSAPPPAGRMNVCIADHQSAGRGRRGRRWTAPPGSALTFSVGWLFAPPPPCLSALPLAVGVATRRALRRVAAVAVELKWPNDLVWDGRKLGGILVESVPVDGGTHVVIGIGINVAMPDDALNAVSDWPRGAVDLARAASAAPPRRAALAAALLEELRVVLEQFESRDGVSALLAEYAEADSLVGQAVSVRQSGGRWSGIARGVEPDGALIVETRDGACRRVVAGHVSIREAS